MALFVPALLALILLRRFRATRTEPRPRPLHLQNPPPPPVSRSEPRFAVHLLTAQPLATFVVSPSLNPRQARFGRVPWSLPCQEVRLSTSRTKWCDAAPRSNEELDDDDEEIVGGALGLGKRVLLVYELMCNGSLQDALLGRKSPELLDWGRRFSIAADIAKGLQFLHEVCDPSVIHGDIKPSNILLDSQFVAKIADFGLARLKATAAGGADEVRYCSWRRRGGGSEEGGGL
ncbi:uncharacterized protein A4U43_C04F22210 [Asparagus officinalis]|uniref:non-specific serine/threonine protein kinase n=1 Tax=Asparagus officinalis TaxID=4686 RepID=A0A5P1F867_ASPOF|nr:uncharacterized protein A4U43_C04F22210 [Asparagus officinalis]